MLRHVLLIAVFAALWRPLRRHVQFRRLAAVVWGAVCSCCSAGCWTRRLGNESWAARLLRYYWFRASDVFVPLGVSLAVVMHLARGALSARTCRGDGTGGHHLSGRRQLVPDRSTPCIGKSSPPRIAREASDESRVGSMARCLRLDPLAASSAQAIFLTPTDHQTFKWYAQRAELVTWKDVPQDAESIVEWSERLTRRPSLAREHDGGGSNRSS